MKPYYITFLIFFSGISQALSQANAGPDQTICTNSTYMQAVDPSPNSGVWVIIAGSGTFENQTLYNTFVSAIGYGDNVYEWEVSVGQEVYNDQVVITNSAPSAADINGPTNTETCDGTITLTANMPIPYYADTQYWGLVSGNATFNDPVTDFTIDISDLAPGNNLFSWTVESGICSNEDFISIINNQVNANAGADLLMCNDNTFLNATDPLMNFPNQGVGQWTTAFPGIIITNPYSENTFVSNIPIGSITFQWKVTLGNCTSTDQVVISNMSVDATAFNTETCDGTAYLTGNIPAPGESGIWTSFTPGIIYDDQDLYNTGVHGLSAGNNTFVWTISNANCSDQAVINVNYIDAIANAGPDQHICTDVTYMAALNPYPGIGEWSVLIGSGTFENPASHNSLVSNIGSGANIYKWTVNDSGCIETSTVTITNHLPIVSAGSDFSTCFTNAVLSAIPPQTGETGTWTVISGTGMVANIHQYNSLVISISPGANTFQWSIDNGICTASDQMTIFNLMPAGISAGLDRIICSDSTVLAALPPGAGESGQWDALSGSAVFEHPEIYNTNVYSLSQGDNFLRWTVSNGSCLASDIVVITNNLPYTPNVPPDDAICSSVYTLLGSPPETGETGLWTQVSGASGNILDPTANITIVQSLGLGPNTFRWTVTKGVCSLYDDIVITNNSFTIDAGPDFSVCETSAQLAGENPSPGSGIWSIINSSGIPHIQNPGLYNTSVSDLGIGANIFQWSVTKNGCSAWDIITITNDLPTTPNAGSDQSVCEGNTTLNGNNPIYGTGAWSVSNGTGTIANPINYQTTVSGLSPGQNTFTWTITNGLCISSDDVVITYVPIQVNAGPDDYICGDVYPALNGNPPLAGETGQWTVISGSGVFANPNLFNSAVSGLVQGQNTMEWTITRGACSESDQVVIFNDTPTTSNVSSDKEICSDNTFVCGNPPTIGVGHWETVSGCGVFDNSVNTCTTVRSICPEINVYRWIITNGSCSTYDDITINNYTTHSTVGNTQNVCGPESYLTGSIPSAGETGVWTVQSGTSTVLNPSLYNTQVTNLNKGFNRFRWTISHSTCSSYADLVVYNNLYDATASVAGPTTTCVDYADLLANIPVTGATGTWSVISGGGIFNNSTSPIARVSELLPGENTMRWTVTKNGCSNWDEVTINNQTVEAYAGQDIVTCEYAVVLNGNALLSGESGLWTSLNSPGLIESPTNNQTMVTGLGAGVNVFRWTVNNSVCTAYDDVQISENAFFTSAGFDQHVCSNTVTLQGQDPLPGTGIWSYSGPAVTIVNPTLNTTVVNGLHENTAHTFRWTVSKQGCTAWDEVVIYNDWVEAYAGTDFTICESTTTLAAEIPVTGSGLWTITSGAGIIENPTYYASPVYGLGHGLNTFVWSVTHLTCIDSDIMTITNNEVLATAGSDIQTCQDQASLNADQPQPGGYGIWETIAGPGTIDNPTAFNTQVHNLQQGVNTFQWTVYQNGCNNGGDLMTVTNNSFDAFAGEDQTLPPLINYTQFEAFLDEGQSGYWSILSGSGMITDIYDPHSEVHSLFNGYNTFAWNVSNVFGCNSSDMVTIFSVDYITDAGPDQIICTDTAKLNAIFVPGAYDQKWSIYSGAGEFDDIYDAETVVRNIAWGVNIYRWSVYFPGYITNDAVMVTDDSIFVSAGDDATICTDAYQMNAEYIEGASHFWTPTGIGGGTIMDNSAWNTLITDLQSGPNVFNWHVDNGNCMSDDSVMITRLETPIVAFQLDPHETVFPNSTVELENLSEPGLDLYYWNFGDGEDLYQTEWVGVLAHTYATWGTFYITLTGTSEENCQTQFMDSVIILEPNGVDEMTGEFLLYPNPANNKVTISSTIDLSETGIEIENVSGQSVYFNIIKPGTHTLDIDISNLATGLYMVKLSTNGKTTLIKLVKK